jgi:hypothetical protein
MNNAVQTRQRMLALALPLTAALYIGAEGVNGTACRRRQWSSASSRHE